MKYIADTHVVVWWFAADPRLGTKFKGLIEEAALNGPPVGVSALTLWELAMLATRGRIELSVPIDEYLSRIESSPTFLVVPLDGRIAAESTRLGALFPRDPVDRIIAATARCRGLSLMTVDDPIRQSGVVALV